MTKLTKPRDFIGDLREGQKWEEKLAKIIENFIINYKIKNIKYSTPEGRIKQKNGLDYEIIADAQGWELKTRSNKYFDYGDLLLETISIEEKNEPGWAYTSQADVIAYVWKTKNNLNLMSKGYLILIKKLRETAWFKTIPSLGKHCRASSFRGSWVWHTISRAIKIEDFPPRTLYEFDPTLESTAYKQVTLDRPDKLTSYFGGS